MKKGEAKIEFFSNLNYLKKEFESGLVVSKFLYKKAKNNINLQMTYKQFNKYFNEVFINNQTKTIKTPKNNNEIIKVNVENEPVKLQIKPNNKKVFDAKFGKKFNDNDIL
ncbi:TPA: hypothetical protein RPW02_001748 [Campylobacter fetus subsp. venerealis]|uniref:Uncharacterized protein n=1 Tax=Campylobacter fetus TaxID=196 RepID=A0A7D7Q984_CAMFE|nr:MULTISPECIES: hypothetical protein [Campylobacter]MBE7358723.1 hypothetical protein [Campylobacter sp. RM11302]MBK3499482.1 hypothetical protein [Campylobacter fetus subsp. venerealis]MBK3503444.1 hypothetical protein [Campylobacter fetus subsp. venerealis]OCS33374.1 hypothetical protein AWR29_08485 [Campylobacter fetus subsp. venerealis]QMS69514.1 hypothetical protein GZ984_009185 [Campylobacter fetus]